MQDADAADIPFVDKLFDLFYQLTAGDCVLLGGHYQPPLLPMHADARYIKAVVPVKVKQIS
jgi:hypothetical protein